jgi:Ni/Fe-hydrogenase subunit HybB-like protein
LTPGAAPKSATYLWSERPREEVESDLHLVPEEAGARTVYDVAHAKPWGTFVSLYLWTKSMAAGPVLMASLLMLLGLARAPLLFGLVAPLLAIVFTAVTTLLLVGDLERPERFFKILTHPNWRSWLVWGGWILIFFSGVSLLWLAAAWTRLGILLGALLWPGLLLAAMTAGYSAFLLAQARARDLWQSRLLFPHLLVQAALAGSALLVLASTWLDSGEQLRALLVRCLLVALCIHGLFLLAEIALPHGTRDASGAVAVLIRGPLSLLFWSGAIFVGVALPIHLLAYAVAHPLGGGVPPALASSLALAGLLAFEDCYIRAGQALPLS